MDFDFDGQMKSFMEKSKNNEIYRKWGLKERTNQEIREDYIKRAAGVVSKLGLTLPEINLKDYD